VAFLLCIAKHALRYLLPHFSGDWPCLIEICNAKQEQI